MSEWTHPICDECFNAKFAGQTATRLKVRFDERCCSCDKITSSGIYHREDPDLLPFHRSAGEGPR